MPSFAFLCRISYVIYLFIYILHFSTIHFLSLPLVWLCYIYFIIVYSLIFPFSIFSSLSIHLSQVLLGFASSIYFSICQSHYLSVFPSQVLLSSHFFYFHFLYFLQTTTSWLPFAAPSTKPQLPTARRPPRSYSPSCQYSKPYPKPGQCFPNLTCQKNSCQCSTSAWAASEACIRRNTGNQISCWGWRGWCLRWCRKSRNLH